jgi:hypothetical protein
MIGTGVAQEKSVIGARELLTPVYDWFTEGFDTPDLIDAKLLLDELDDRRATGCASPRTQSSDKATDNVKGGCHEP